MGDAVGEVGDPEVGVLALGNIVARVCSQVQVAAIIRVLLLSAISMLVL